MAKAIWKGTLSFSLVQINVSLVVAEGREEQIRFRELDPKDNTPIRQKKINAATGEEVPKTVKGYEVSAGTFMPITEEEIAGALPVSSRIISVGTFVDQAAIPPVYFGRPYYLLPTGRMDHHAYALLYRVLAEQGLAGIGQMVMRTKQYLVAVMPYERILAAVVLRYRQELRHPKNLGFAVNEDAVAAGERDLALRIVNALRGEWDPGPYRDEYQEKILKIIAAKHRTGKVRPPADTGRRRAVSDLMSQLRSSLKKASASRTGPAAKTSRYPARSRGPSNKRRTRA